MSDPWSFLLAPATGYDPAADAAYADNGYNSYSPPPPAAPSNDPWAFLGAPETGYTPPQPSQPSAFDTMYGGGNNTPAPYVGPYAPDYMSTAYAQLNQAQQYQADQQQQAAAYQNWFDTLTQPQGQPQQPDNTLPGGFKKLGSGEVNNDPLFQYGKGVWDAVANAYDQPTKQGMNPLEWVGDTFAKTAQAAGGALGAVTAPIGSGVDTLADSSVPGLNVAGGAIRNVWEQAVEPAANLFTGTIGEAASGANQFLGDVYGDVTSGNFGKVGSDLGKDLSESLARQPLVRAAYSALNPWTHDVMNQYAISQSQQLYQQLIAQGMDPQEAQRQATREGIKLMNPITQAEVPAMEDFSKLNPVEQLFVQFTHANPANVIYDQALKPLMKPYEALGDLTSRAVGAGTNALVDATGTRPFFNQLGRAIEGPQKGLATYEREKQVALNVVRQAEQALGDMKQAEQAVYLDPESPFYWEKQGINPEIANEARDWLGVIDLNAEQKSGVMTPQQETLPQNEVDMARREQDTSTGAAKTLFDEQTPKPGNVYDATWQDRADRLQKEYQAEVQRVQDANPGRTVQFDANEKPTLVDPNGTATALTDPALENAYKTAQHAANNAKAEAADLASRPAPSQDSQVNAALTDFRQKRATDLREGRDTGKPMGAYEADEKAAVEAEDFRAKIKTPEDLANFENTYKVGRQSDIPPAPPADLNDSFTQRLYPPRPDKITEMHRAIGIPDTYHTHEELLNAAVKSLGFKRKAYVFKEGTTIAKSELRKTRPLEQFGVAGKILNKFGDLTMPYMGRAFLNKSGRAIRDTASNLLKYAVEGFGHSGDTNPRFARVREMLGLEDKTLPMNRASALADIGGKEARGGTLKEIFFHVLNPFDELSSDLLNAVSKGKYRDWNVYTEKKEEGFKTYAYKREFLRLWDQAIEDRIRTGALDPVIGRAIKDGTLTEQTVKSFMDLRMPEGARIDDVAKGVYNPQNYSDALQVRYANMFKGEAGPIGDIVRDGLNDLPDLVGQHNLELKKEFDKKVAALRPGTRDYSAQLKTLRANYEASRVKLADVRPGHPLWEKMTGEMFDKLDVANKAAQIQESMDPAIRAAVRNQILDSMDYMANQGRVSVLKTALAARIDKRDTRGFFNKYIRKTPAPAEPGGMPRDAAETERYKKDLKAQIQAYGKTEGHSTSANLAQKVLDGKPDVAGKVVFRSDRADGPHFRIDTPENAGRNGQDEYQVWPPKPRDVPAQPLGPYANSRDRILAELKGTGYNPKFADAGMQLLDQYARAYEADTGRSANEIYDSISFKKGDKVAPGALEQTADIRRRIEEEHNRLRPDDTRYRIPSQFEIPGVRSSSNREGPSRIALRNDENRRNGPAVSPELAAHGTPEQIEQAQIDRFVEGAMAEIDYQLSLPDARSGRTWYTDSWVRAMENIKRAMPELQSDVDGERLFKLFTGLTSQGTEVDQNLTKSILAFDRYAKSGRIRVTKIDAAPVDLAAMGFTPENLTRLRDFFSGAKRDWTDYSSGAASLRAFTRDDLARAKKRLETQALKWLRDRSQATGITDPETIHALYDLFTTREFRSDVTRALDWASHTHTKAEVKRIYADMVNEFGTSEVFNRMLDVEYPGVDGSTEVPGARVLGPTPTLFGTETANFIKLADLVNNRFHGNIRLAMDWLQTKHTAEEIRPVLEQVLNSPASVRTYMTRIRKAIEDDAAFHQRAGDVGPDYVPGEYGSTIFGPKIGNFVANLLGAPDRTTKDMWFTITWNRLMGNLGDANAPVLEAPTTGQVSMMDRAMADLVRRYRARNIDITMSQAQALLWFYEKQLAEIHGRGGTSDNFETTGPAALASAEQTGDGFRQGRPVPPTYRNITAMGLDIPTDRPDTTGLLPQQAGGKMVLGTTEITDNGRYIISIFENANASTMPHELAHVFRQFLPDELLKAAEDFTGATKGNWTVAQEEKFARGFERYLRDGHAPTPTLAAVFKQFHEWLKRIYYTIKGGDIDVKLTPEIKKVFDKMLGGDVDKMAPEKPPRARDQEEDFDGRPADWDIMYDTEGNEIGKYSEQPDFTPPTVDPETGKVVKPEPTPPAPAPPAPTKPVTTQTGPKEWRTVHPDGTIQESSFDPRTIPSIKPTEPPTTGKFEANVQTTTYPNEPRPQAARPVSIRPFDLAKPAEIRHLQNNVHEAVWPITLKSGTATPIEIATRWVSQHRTDEPPNGRLTKYQIRDTKGHILADNVRYVDLEAKVKAELRQGWEGAPKTLRQEAAEHTPAELARYDQAINGSKGIRMDTEDGKQGQVITPSEIRKIVGNWNRGRHGGELKTDRYTLTQKKQYFRDILATDEYIRSVTGNTFKLDLDSFTPVRISDGKSLDELMGRTRPSAVGEAAPKWPAGEPPNTPEQVVKEVEDYFGGDARKGFSQIEKEQGKEGVTRAYSEIARRLGFPDPTEVTTPTERVGLETDEARKVIQALNADANRRYEQAKVRPSRAQDQADARSKAEQGFQNRLFGDLSGVVTDIDRAAYNRVEGVYFDYQNKNVIDQMVGTLLPFNYWARRNFAYVARYFANNPVQFAAVLQFYKNMEQQNKEAGGIAPYNMGNLLLWTNPDGSKVQWNMSSMLPLNPLGNSQALMQVIDADDAQQDDNPANNTPLAMLFGYDTTYKGKVTGRQKGIIPTFLSPNPVIDILLKTGQVNEFAKKLGIVTDGFLSPDPSDKRGLNQTTGLVAGRTIIRDVAARTGLTDFIREQASKLGIKFTDLDLEAPLNELVFGVNSGKPLTAVEQELTEMAQGDPKNQEQYLFALAKLKVGNWTPEALKALDVVESQTAWQRAASLAGFVGVINNTPRQQLSNQLSNIYGSVANDKGHYEVTATDPKTGYQTKKFVPGQSQTFFDENPGATVSFARNKTSDQIVEGIGNDRTVKALADLNKAYYDDKTMSLRDYNKGLDDLKKGNPTYFKVAKDKDYQQAKGELPYLPGETHSTVAQVDTKYAKQEIPGERQYAEWKDDLYRAGGGDRWQTLNDQISAAFDKGDKETAYKIEGSAEYKQLRDARNKIIDANVPFADRREQEDAKTYGTKPKNAEDRAYEEWKDQLFDAGGSGRYQILSDQISKFYDAGNKKGAYPILDSAEYKQLKAARTAVENANPKFAARYKAENDAKYGTTSSSSSSSGSSGGSTKSSSGSTYYTTKKTTSYSSSGSKNSSNSDWTTAQKNLYGRLRGQGYSAAAAASVVNRPGSTNPKPSSTATTARPPAPTGVTAPSGTSTSTNQWDSVQRHAYALALADGHTAAYAAAVANRIGSGQSSGYKSTTTGQFAGYSATNPRPTGGVGSPTTPATSLSTQQNPAGQTGANSAASSGLVPFWERNANGDNQASAQDMQDNGWTSGAAGYTSYASARKAAESAIAHDPSYIRVVVFDPDKGSYAVWEKGFLKLSALDSQLVRSETIAKSSTSGYSSSRGGGGGRSRGSSGGSGYIHPPVAPYRLPSPYSGGLNRLNKGRKF